ncbi:MAG TPA: lysozyme inhibitor LprI family protein [Terriglobales bacterium]|nr:lysozyme inhibitor LprI family protein [Terriglobales bacterium]
MKSWVLFIGVPFLGVTFLLATATAQEEETKCDGTTYDTSVCLSKIHEKVEAQLDVAYQAILKIAERYPPKDVANFKDAEQKWIEFRDAQCKAEYGLWGGGSGGPNARTMCLIRVTRQRIADLNIFREK